MSLSEFIVPALTSMQTVFIMLMLCGVCLSCTGAYAAEWVRYFSDKLGNEWFYDRESVSYPSKGIVGVRGKGIYSKDGVREEIAERTKSNSPTQGFDGLSYIMERFEVNCKKSEFEVYERGYYNRAGKILHAFTTPKKRSYWYAINPESKMDALYKCVCKLQGKETNKKNW
jgi:hypothetical protein